MQYSVAFCTLAICFVADLLATVTANPVSVGDAAALKREDEVATPTVMSQEEMLYWLANTDAEITYVGPKPNILARQSDTITVTYCTTEILGICGGKCTVYTGGPTCINAPGTACIGATGTFAYCTQSGCNGNCIVSCPSPIEYGFCNTPGTNSIVA